jgi:hypothetical protein
VNKANKKPVPGARIEAWDADEQCTDMLAFASTDASGQFNMTLSQGAVVGLLADRKPMVALRVFDATGAPLPDPTWRWELGPVVTRARIEVLTETEERPTRTPTNCVVRGRVRTFRGASIPGATVYVFDADGTDPISEAFSFGDVAILSCSPTPSLLLAILPLLTRLASPRTSWCVCSIGRSMTSSLLHGCWPSRHGTATRPRS